MNIFKKLKRAFGLEKEGAEPTFYELGDQLKNADLDFKFAQLFTYAGGYFNFCENEKKALQTLENIMKAENLKSAFCFDENLQDFLNVVKLSFSENLSSENDCAFITCEYLIAYDGRIMLSANNIKHLSKESLPSHIIIMANVSQIVQNLTSAMTKIKRRGNVKNLTSISGNISQLDSMKEDNTKLFLLLLED